MSVSFLKRGEGSSVMFLKRGEGSSVSKASAGSLKPQALRAGSQLTGKQKSFSIVNLEQFDEEQAGLKGSKQALTRSRKGSPRRQAASRLEEDSEGADEEFDLGRFFNSAEAYNDNLYMKMAVNLFQKAPEDTPLRSPTMAQSLARRANPESMKARDKIVEKQVTFTLPSVNSVGDTVYKVSYKLPVDRDKPSREARHALLKMLDGTNSGKMSIDDLIFGFTRVVKMPGVDHVEDMLDEVVRLAHGAVQDLMLDGAPRREDDVLTKEFRVFLTYLQAYLDMWEMFKEADQGNTEVIDMEEFCKVATKLKEWGLSDPALIKNPMQVFQQIDVDDSGRITFSEFADFCVKSGDMMEGKDLQIT